EPGRHRLRRVERRHHLGEGEAGRPARRGARQGRRGAVRLGRPHHAGGVPRRGHVEHVLRRLRHHRAVPRGPRPGAAPMRIVRLGVVLLLAAAAAPGAAQTMLEQQERLIDIHSLLLDLPPLEAPGALRPFQVSLGVEGITIPSIDGATGTRRQITASDHTPLFPRPRLMVGLPAPGALRAFAGLAYIPPVTVADVATHYGAAEAGLAYAPGPLSVALRGHAVYAFSKSPVTDPATRDTLESFLYGADVGAGYALDAGWASFTP